MNQTNLVVAEAPSLLCVRAGVRRSTQDASLSEANFKLVRDATQLMLPLFLNTGGRRPEYLGFGYILD